MDAARVLIVDDDDAIADIESTYLKREGGLTALSLAKQGHWGRALFWFQVLAWTHD